MARQNSTDIVKDFGKHRAINATPHGPQHDNQLPMQPCVGPARVGTEKLGQRYQRLRENLAGEPGFEPRSTESESAVLPLNYSPTCAGAELVALASRGQDRVHVGAACSRLLAPIKSFASPVEKFVGAAADKRRTWPQMPVPAPGPCLAETCRRWPRRCRPARGFKPGGCSLPSLGKVRRPRPGRPRG